MSGGIFLIQDSGTLVELSEMPYEAEDLLQRLLADYPRLLSGDQFDDTVPRRWLLINREAAVPSEEGGPGRWSLDHLFVDRDAVPTLVEVKRSSDTRIRREVVGQMLDYASNAVVYWPVEVIRAQFEANCEEAAQEPFQALSDCLGGGDPEAFWLAVKRNLQAGRIRMVFVADMIPPELRRIVEFLNGQMDPAEVLALEVRQFVGQGLKALVPRTLGQTAKARQAKTVPLTSSGRRWDEASFMAELQERRGSRERDVAQEILDWAIRQRLRISWGKGAKDGSFYPMVDHSGGTDWTISVWTGGGISIQFKELSGAGREGERHVFADEAMRRLLLIKLNDIPGVAIPETAISKYPSIRLSALAEPGALQMMLTVLDWLVSEIRKTDD